MLCVNIEVESQFKTHQYSILTLLLFWVWSFCSEWMHKTFSDDWLHQAEKPVSSPDHGNRRGLWKTGCIPTLTKLIFQEWFSLFVIILDISSFLSCQIFIFMGHVIWEWIVTAVHSKWYCYRDVCLLFWTCKILFVSGNFCVLYYMYIKLSPCSSLTTLVLNETH